MDYYLTKHAKQRMAERAVSVRLLDEALHNPTEILYDSDSRVLYKYIYIRENIKRLLMIAVIIEKSRIKVITVIDTSKVRKYL